MVYYFTQRKSQQDGFMSGINLIDDQFSEGYAIHAESNCILRLVWNIMSLILSSGGEVGRYLQKDRFHRAFHG
jgi:hypothetical protein